MPGLKPLALLAILSKIRILAQNLPPAAGIRLPLSTSTPVWVGGGVGGPGVTALVVLENSGSERDGDPQAAFPGLQEVLQSFSL